MRGKKAFGINPDIIFTSFWTNNNWPSFTPNNKWPLQTKEKVFKSCLFISPTHQCTFFLWRIKLPQYKEFILDLVLEIWSYIFFPWRIIPWSVIFGTFPNPYKHSLSILFGWFLSYIWRYYWQVLANIQ